MSDDFDLAVIGGGIMGCAAARQAAAGGMRSVVIEQATLGSGASGVNAGTLSLQIKRVKLMPYALKGHELWSAAGDAVGFRRTGGVTLAFNAREADLLHERMAMKRAAGADIEMIAPARVAEIEPAISKRVVAASWCADDGYANSSLTGAYYRKLLGATGVQIVEGAQVGAIGRDRGAFEIVTPKRVVSARRLLLACGAWLKSAGAMLGIDLPIRARVNTVSVTERGPKLMHGIVGHATGLLTMKQSRNGTILVGGGWQGQGTPEAGRGRVDPDTMLPNLQLAQYALPEIERLRIVRSWTGYEANVPDFFPLAGAVPGVEGAFILGCVRGGYTIGPYIGALMGDLILGCTPEMPLFDPARFLDTPSTINRSSHEDRSQPA